MPPAAGQGGRKSQIISISRGNGTRSMRSRQRQDALSRILRARQNGVHEPEARKDGKASLAPEGSLHEARCIPVSSLLESSKLIASWGIIYEPMWHACTPHLLIGRCIGSYPHPMPHLPPGSYPITKPPGPPDPYTPVPCVPPTPHLGHVAGKADIQALARDACRDALIAVGDVGGGNAVDLEYGILPSRGVGAHYHGCPGKGGAPRAAASGMRNPKT
jgi:hypothetical protein